MKLFPRLVVRKFWGQPTPPPFTYDLTSEKNFSLAKSSGGLQGLEVLRGFDSFDEEGALDSGAALILRSQRVFPQQWNGEAAWEPHGSATFEVFSNPFGNGLSGQAYENDGEPAEFSSTATLADNQPFVCRVYLFKSTPAEEGQPQKPRSIWRLSFGSFALRIRGTAFELTRASKNWTASAQQQLEQLEDLEEPTPEQQEQIEQLRGPRRVVPGGVEFPDAIYDIVENLSLGESSEHVGGQFYEISILPEPRGYLNIWLGNNKPVAVKIPEVLLSRKSGQIYKGGKIHISTNGQPFLWQVGEFRFAPYGALRIGPMKNGYWTDTIDQSVRNVQADSSLPGTAVQMHYSPRDSVWFEFRVEATTTDRRYTPFFYGAEATLPAGARSGGDGVAWDSNDQGANSPIIDMEPQFEGGVMRRQQWRVTLRDPSGSVLNSLADGQNLDALENRIVDLAVGTTDILKTGIVTEAQISDAARVRFATAMLRQWLLKPKSRITITVCDGWEILDQDVMADSPIGDGVRLGKYVRLHLKNNGWKDSEMTGVLENAGRELPRAAAGEEPCVRPNRGQTRGQFLRELVEKYGMGLTLWIDANGVWQLSNRSREVKTIAGHPAEFHSNVNHNNMTYPQRFAVLSPLDHLRDTSDCFYNHFRVEGWVDPATGQRIASEFTIQESVTAGANPSLKYIGRLRKYPTVRDNGLRSADDVQYALRSLVALYGRSCRFLQFTTYFHVGLSVGDRVNVDGQACEVVRISGGSMARDRMQLVVMELEV